MELAPLTNTDGCGVKGLEKTGDVDVHVLPGGVEDEGMPNMGVDTVRGEAYIADAAAGGVGRDRVRRAVERTGDSGGWAEDRFWEIGERLGEESLELRSVSVMMLGGELREGTPEGLRRMVPVPSERDGTDGSVLPRERLWIERAGVDGSVISKEVAEMGSSCDSSPLNMFIMLLESHSADVLLASAERGISLCGGSESGAPRLGFVRSISPTLALLRRALDVEPFPRECPRMWPSRRRGLMVCSGVGEAARVDIAIACSISSSLVGWLLLGWVGRGLE